MPIRVLCLNRAPNARSTLVAGDPLVKGGRNLAQRDRGPQRSADGLRAHQLVARAVEYDPYDPERPLPRARGEPHRLHVDGDRATRVQFGAPLADGDLLRADDAPHPYLHPQAGQPANQLSGQSADDGLLRVTLVGRRVEALGDDHFAGHGRLVEAPAEAEHEHRAGGATAERAGGGARLRRPHAGLVDERPAGRRGDQRRLEAQRRRDEDLAHAATATRAAAWPLSTALSSVAGD